MDLEGNNSNSSQLHNVKNKSLQDVNDDTTDIQMKNK